MDVHVPQVVGQVLEVPKTACRDRSLEYTAEQILDVPVPEMVKQLVEEPKTVEDPQFEIVEKTVENPETQISDVVIDASLTCDAKCKVACETCVKDNMFMVAGEITVAGKMDDLDSADSKCEVLFHVNKQSLDFASGVHVDTADFDVDEDGQDTMLWYAGDETENVAILTSSMSTHLGKKLSVVAPRAAAQHRSTQSPQQRNHNKPEQQTEQAIQERESREREKGRKGEGEKREKERAAEEEGDKEVERDVTDWVEVRRRIRRKRRKMVQIFVKVNGGKTSAMEMEMSDKVDDIVKKIPISDRDVYVTSGGRVLKRSDKLESCEVRDGSTIQVTSRMRGGGRHTDRKSKVEKKQVMRQEPLKSEGPAILESEKEAVIRMLEETEEYRKIVEDVSGGSDVDVERKMRHWASKLQERPRGDILECGLRWAVEARRKGRNEQQEQRRQAKQGKKTEQEQSKQVRFGEEQQLVKTGAENAGEPEGDG